ncbi:MAG: sodium-dependent transporter [Dysgonamonadaceae bacterium]|jgi:NSS family neurotransmitter:Na+ symporter|nr:sodium-dependent transporter [Dysgonamonadaceae bacterium]
MKRDGFGSQLGALMALIGSAVGLGNLWKFPYMTGINGGAAFIIIYAGFMFILCLPLMLSEFIIGRRSQSNPVGAFRKIYPKGKWYYTGILGVLGAFIILSFYSVVGGWAFKYFFTALQFGFTDIAGAESQFNQFIQSPFEPIFLHLLFLGITMAILWTGVKNGIEKYSKILMPLLFFMVLILAVYAINLPDAKLGIDFMIRPDWSKVTPSVILNALGQGLFSLSLGMGAVITYSSYMGKTENLTKIAVLTILMDLVFALLAGLVVLPAVFSFGFEPTQGPGLLFIILPEVFASMPGGNLFGIVFFIVLLIAAITSAISLLEVITSYLTEEKKISRHKALIYSGIALLITGSVCSLSMGVLSDILIFGKNIFDFFDMISSTYIMPIGAFFIAVFVGWKMKKKDVKAELSNNGKLKLRTFNLFLFLVRFFVPIAIVVIFLNLLGIF